MVSPVTLIVNHENTYIQIYYQGNCMEWGLCIILHLTDECVSSWYDKYDNSIN